MANNNTAEKPRRKLKISHILIALLIIIVAGFALFRLSLKSKLRAKLDAISAAGYPVTCAELDDWYAIPESAENAAYTFTDSFSYYRKWEKEKRKLLPIIGEAELPLRTEPLAEDTKVLIAEYLADNQQALELLHKGAAIEHCRYPVDLSKGFAVLLPDLSDIRTGAKLLQLEAALHADNAEAELAARSITSSFGLARSLSKEPILVSQLVRIACQALAVSALEHAINKTEFTDEQLVNLSRTLANAEDLSGMTRAFAGERCAGVSIFKAPASNIVTLLDETGNRPLPLGVLAISLYRFAGLADMDAIMYVNLMEGYIEAAQLPPHKRQSASDAVVAKIGTIPKIHILLRMIMPALGRVTTIDVRVIAQLRTARVGFAIERYRLASGRLPDALSELVPAYLEAVPKDPFDDKELRYKKLDTGFVVYSIGEDGNDDGGKERPRKRPRPSGPADVTFIIQR
ncbi:hypothetical protein ES703_103599 [subsurface metagenome]